MEWTATMASTHSPILAASETGLLDSASTVQCSFSLKSHEVSLTSENCKANFFNILFSNINTFKSFFKTQKLNFTILRYSSRTQLLICMDVLKMEQDFFMNKKTKTCITIQDLHPLSGYMVTNNSVMT